MYKIIVTQKFPQNLREIKKVNKIESCKWRVTIMWDPLSHMYPITPTLAYTGHIIKTSERKGNTTMAWKFHRSKKKIIEYLTIIDGEDHPIVVPIYPHYHSIVRP